MPLNRRSGRERGDTIIEVILAVVIFSLVAIGSLAVMNRGVAAAERTLEITLARQQMDAQAEALRFIHDTRLAAVPGSNSTWVDIINNHSQSRASSYGNHTGCSLPGAGYQPFVLNARTAQLWGRPTVEPAAGSGYPPYPQVIYAGSSVQAAYGLWIEAVPSPPTPRVKRYVDFHIRACWTGPGSSIPVTLGTIVRLYDPS